MTQGHLSRRKTLDVHSISFYYALFLTASNSRLADLHLQKTGIPSVLITVITSYFHHPLSYSLDILGSLVRQPDFFLRLTSILWSFILSASHVLLTTSP